MTSKAALWTGRVLSGLVILFLTVDGAIKLVPIQPVTDSLRELGYPTSDSFARFLERDDSKFEHILHGRSSWRIQLTGQ
jgi:hypothetical protein